MTAPRCEMAAYFLIDDGGRDGPYSEEDLLDMIDADELSAGAVCENADTGRRMRVRQLFQVIKPEPPSPPPSRATPANNPAADDPADDEREDDEEEGPEEPEAMPPAPPTARWVPAPLTEESPMATLRPLPARVCYAGHSSLLIHWRGLTLSAAFLGAGWYLGRFQGPWLTGGLLCGLLTAMVTLLLRSRTEYLITTRHVEMRAGLLSKSSREIRLMDIRSINVRKAGLAGLLGVGDVEFSSAAGDTDDVTFRNVSGAHRLKELVRRLQERAP